MGAVDFDFSFIGEKDGQLVAVIGVTIRQDTSYAETLAIAMQEKYLTNFEEIFRIVMKEIYKRGGKIITVHESYVPSTSKNKLGLELVTKDIMMMKKLT